MWRNRISMGMRGREISLIGQVSPPISNQAIRLRSYETLLIPFNAVWESEAWLQKFAKPTEDGGEQGQAAPAQTSGEDED